MDVISYSAFRSNLANTLDRINDNHKPVMITRQNDKPAVVMSLEDFNSYRETAYFMASPKNVGRLNETIRQIEDGEADSHEIIKE